MTGAWDPDKTAELPQPNLRATSPHTPCTLPSGYTPRVVDIVLTRTVRTDFGDKKITVNAVAPGGIKTDMYHAVCREYIPNGENLSDEEVDEVSSLTNIRTKVTTKY